MQLWFAEKESDMSDDSIKAIQKRMKEVRRELGNDLATSARDITNWRSYVRASPWICLGAAVAIGYLVVPKKSPTVVVIELTNLSNLHSGSEEVDTADEAAALAS